MVSHVEEIVAREPLTLLSDLTKRPSVNLEFENLQYYTKRGYFGGEWSELLKSVSGHFRSGQLIAIMGPSGAGKTTLMNILSGNITTNFKGSIRMNGKLRDLKICRKLCCFIEQENTVQPHLTVQEAMRFAADVKVDACLSDEQKSMVIDEVMDLLGLQHCRETRSERLSGGQSRRLSVALEILGNPPVIFLDEPVTGLDNYMAKQCVQTLRKLSQLGRTVICTIHQPPSSLFQMFDQVYILANGYCVYNGQPKELVSFLSTAGYPCPQNYTPVEYTIEIVHMYPECIDPLSKHIENGHVDVTSAENFTKISENRSFDYNQLARIEFPAPFWKQVCMLVKRMFVQTSRNKVLLYMQFFFHLMMGLLLGALCYKMGNNGSHASELFKSHVFILTIFMFTYVMCPVMLYPLEMKLLQMEYLNRWYSLRAYFMAITVTSLPLLVILVTMFSIIIYLLIDQPLEMDRMVGFCLTGIASALASQGLGHTIGATFAMTSGAFVSSGIMIYFFLLAIHGLGYGGLISPFMGVQMYLNFLRQAVVSYCNVLFYKRPPLDCTEEIYCYYGRPEVLMKDLGFPINHYSYSLGLVLVLTLLFRIAWYFALKRRMNSRLEALTNVIG